MKASSKQNKEKLILDTAIKLFSTKGYHETKIDDVANGAKISKGLTYFYFKNKEDLYMAVTKKAFDELIKDVFKDPLKTKGKNGMDMISMVCISFMDFGQKNPLLVDSIINFMRLVELFNNELTRVKIDPKILESEHFLKLLEIQHDCAKLGIQMITTGIKDGSIRPELQPEITFYTVWSVLIGYLKLKGTVDYENKDFKIQSENWKHGLIKLIQDMLKGTMQPQKPQIVQTSLF
jgi:AcrR family transcriptional regulator